MKYEVFFGTQMTQIRLIYTDVMHTDVTDYTDLHGYSTQRDG